MIIAYYSHSKKHSKDVEFVNFRISKYFSKSWNFKKKNYHMQMGCNVHDIWNKVVAYNTRN
jgi:hypothetical protein